MKDVARLCAIALMLILLIQVVVCLVFFAGDGAKTWEFVKSPKTGICYERHSYSWLLGGLMGIAPVPDEYCEEESHDR